MSATTAPVQLQRSVLDFLGEQRKMLIDGSWVEAASGKTFETYNPATGEVLANVAAGIAPTSTVPLKQRAQHLRAAPGPISRPRNEDVCCSDSRTC